MSVISDVTGERFGKLVAIRLLGKFKDGRYHWLCKCDCGNEKTATLTDLRTGHTKSCGCLRREETAKRAKGLCTTHGLTNHPLYHVWTGIIDRCTNENKDNYKNYGGRGITVCDEWRNDFKKFYDDNISGYRKGLQIDRIDNDKGYLPGNCRWVTAKRNARNRRSTRMLNGVAVIDICEGKGINPAVVRNRINSGWSVEDAINTPVRKRRGSHKAV